MINYNPYIKAIQRQEVSDDEKQQDWDDLRHRETWKDGFVAGAIWMRDRMKDGVYL